jgi:hypothetical protein
MYGPERRGPEHHAINSSEGGSVGKNWFAQASKIVPGSELRAPLMERLCGSEMDFDLQVKEL